MLQLIWTYLWGQWWFLQKPPPQRLSCPTRRHWQPRSLVLLEVPLMQPIMNHSRNRAGSVMPRQLLTVSFLPLSAHSMNNWSQKSESCFFILLSMVAASRFSGSQAIVAWWVGNMLMRLLDLHMRRVCKTPPRFQEQLQQWKFMSLHMRPKDPYVTQKVCSTQVGVRSLDPSLLLRSPSGLSRLKTTILFQMWVGVTFTETFAFHIGMDGR